MSKRAWQIFGTFAVIFAVVIPFWVLETKGSEGAANKAIPSYDHQAQQLFQTNCGACHTLAAGGTDGVLGPNLDVLLAGNATKSQDSVDGNCGRVLSAVLGGIGGRMPKGILTGDDAQTVASFVARNLNYIGDAPPTSGQPAAPITPQSTKCGSSSSSGSGQPANASNKSSGSSGGGSASGGGGASGGGATGAPGAAKGGSVAISADPTGQLKFEQSKVTTNAGPVKIDFTNKSPVGHDVKIKDSSGKELGGTDLVTGGTGTATVDLQAGTYTFYCSVPGHEQAGMTGTLVVK